MKTLKKFIVITERLSGVLGSIASCLVAIMITLVGVEVFMRYVFDNPPLLADEFAAYLLVAVSFFGISQAFLEGSHVKITFLSDKLSIEKARWLRLFILVFSEIFLIIMVYSNYEYLSFSMMIDERSSSWVHFPLKYSQSTILIGFTLFAIVLLGHIAKLTLEIRNQDQSTI
ncbi:MAG: TRAP transporter small permease [Desulfobulbaceae bacterium]|nr:TRAP transporter small permease [Desulfobulbaceae bacterium]